MPGIIDTPRTMTYIRRCWRRRRYLRVYRITHRERGVLGIRLADRLNDDNHSRELDFFLLSFFFNASHMR